MAGNFFAEVFVETNELATIGTPAGIQTSSESD